jgi:hypothetical protein
VKTNHIFKFYKINKHLIESLVHSQIYFARPETLNDPFDCQVDVHKAHENAVKQLSGLNKKILESLFDTDFQRFLNKRLHELNNFGIFSASHKASLTNPLLWSHYANEHKGICLGYSIPINLCSPVSGVIGIVNVKYGENTLTEWFLDLPLNTKIHAIAFEEMMKMILTIKSSCWQYEDEVRVIRSRAGNLLIDQSYLHHICFGLNTSEEDKTLIREIVTKFGYDVGYSQICRTQNDFGITAVDI